MARSHWWKTCKPLKSCDSPDSGESLVVDLKVNSNHSSWVKHIWLCLGEIFVNCVIELLGKSVKFVVVCAFWYVLLYTRCFVWFIIAHGDGHLFLMLYLTEKGTDYTGSAVCSGWENRGRVGLKNWQGKWEVGTSGVVVYLPSEEVTKQFSFICWLYWFICSINTLIPFLFLCTTVFLFPFQFVFVMTVGTWIKVLHIHKETTCSVRQSSGAV